MDINNPYIEVIAVCLVIIVSYIFSFIAKKTNIPSVLLLIFLGVLINFGLKNMGINLEGNLRQILELLGIVGLIMIVLEAALDLELTREKRGLILKSFFIAFFSLLGCSFSIAWIFHQLLIDDFFTSFIYAIPLSIMSSAIIIPSVANLAGSKKEFMVYESTFSDILGIMLFYFILENTGGKSTGAITVNVLTNIGLTILLSVLISYALVLLLQRLDEKVKLFLLIGVLIMLYAIGKLFHLSSLIVILVFGLTLNNYKLFFRGIMRKWIDKVKLSHIVEDFHVVTMESAFVIRTFFFVIFGMSLDLTTLTDIDTALISIYIVSAIFIIRFVFFKMFLMKSILPEVFIAPRGLITVLLFFGIPAMYLQDSFNTGILLYTILLTSVIMTLAILFKGDETDYVDKLNFDSWEELDEEIEKASREKV